MKLHVAMCMVICAPVTADELVTVRTSDDTVRLFDTDEADFVNTLLPLGVPFDFGDLAWDGERVFMVQGFAGTGLYELGNKGEASFIGAHGFTDMFGMVYDPTTDTLYASRSTTGSGFYSLDRETGQATFIGDPGVSLDALSYDSSRDVLIGAHAGPGDLYEVDRATGQVTLLYDGDFFNNCGMTYVPSEDLHWMIDWSGEVYTFDPNDGYERTSITNVGEAYDGLIFLDFTIGVCEADCNGDGVLNILDFVCFQGLFQDGDPDADCNGDGVLNVLDFVCFQGEFVEGC